MRPNSGWHALPNGAIWKTEQEVIDINRKLGAELRTKLPSIFNWGPKSRWTWKSGEEVEERSK